MVTALTKRMKKQVPLKDWPPDKRTNFFNDFSGDYATLRKFDGHPGKVKAWDILRKAGRNDLKLDPDVLAKVSKVLDNPKLDDFLPINTPSRNITTREEMVQQMVNLQGDASTIVGSRMSAMGDLIDEVDHFLVNFADKPGAFDFVKELTESGGKMAGGSFVLKAIKNHPDELGTIVKFESTVSSSADDIGDVVVDVITSKGSVSNIFNEFKNWQSIPSNRYSSFTKQFSGYITSKNFGEFFYNFKKGVGSNGFSDISSLKSDVISAFSSTVGRAELSNIPLSRIRNVLGDSGITEAGKVQALIDHLDDIDDFKDVFKLLD